MTVSGRGAWVRVAIALASSLLTAAQVSATPIPLPGFPVRVDGPVREPIALADVDQDGALDLVVVYENKISVVSSELQTAPGWPVDLAALTRRPSVTLLGPPAVGDIDGDGKPEIALAASFGIEADGAIVVLKGDGQLLWQVPVQAGLSAGCTLADLSGRHSFDVVAGTRGGQVLAFDGRGKSVAGFPARIGAPATSPVAFGGLARGQRPVLAVGANDGKVYVLSSTGQPVRGFPLVTHFVVSGEPAFADLDDDGQGDLIVASQDFNVYAVKADGTPISGFPVSTQYRIYGGPSVGDLDHDGKLDVVVASSDGKVYAWNNKGELFPNFPVSAGSKIDHDGSVILADSSRTGRDSIFVTSTDGNLYGFDSSGAALDGFPLSLGHDGVTAPVVADLVPDESEELVIGTNGQVQGYRLDRSGSLPQGPLSWPGPGHDSTGQGHFGPNPPRYRNAVLTPATPRRGEAIKLGYEYYSLDGAPEPATRIHWTVNGQHVPELDGKHEVPALRTRRGDHWQATVQSPTDYAVYKDGPGATILRSNEVAVVNTPPTAPKVAIDEVFGNGKVQLQVRFTARSTDADGDTITYGQRWVRDERVASTETTIDSKLVRKGEVWKVIVTPSDGEVTGPAGEAQVTVTNTPPTQPVIGLSPAQPTIEDNLSVNVVKPATDADGDQVKYLYAFFVNGHRLALPPERAFLPHGTAHHGDVVKVEVWANDGEANGPMATAEAKIVNAVPKAPTIAIAPAHPHTHDELSAGLVTPARDPDRDPVQYSIRWTRDGVPFGVPGQLVIPAGEVHKGQRWSVEFVPSDGTLQGTGATATVVVDNEPPTQPRLKVSNATPLVTEGSTIDIAEDATDPDGDAIRYELAWSVDGKVAFEDQASTRTTRTVTGTASAPVVAAVVSPPAPVEEAMAKKGKGKKAKKGHHAPEVAPTPVAPVPAPVVGGPVAARSIPIIGKTSLQPGEFKKNQRLLVQVTAVDGDGARSPAGTIEIVSRNTAPGAPQVALEPAEPTIETGLRAVIAAPARDRDGDALTYRYKWYRDGVEATGIGNRPVLKPGELKHGEQWRVVVVAYDGEAEGPAVEATATVKNTAPMAPHIALGPAHATVVTGLNCEVKQPATDADGDTITLAYRWFRDGQPFAVPGNVGALGGEAIRAGQTWRCEVTAFDGKAHSETTSSSIVVEDAVPTTPTVEVEPKVPLAGSPLLCGVTAEALDPDGDRVSYDFRWEPSAGVTVPDLPDPASIPAEVVRKGQSWKCVVTASDGHLKTPVAVSEVHVGNTRPRPPRLALAPAQPEPGQDLECRFASDAFDVDGDRLTYAFTWYRNGVAQSFAPESAGVPGRLVKALDRWSCSVVVSDGTDSSTPAQSQEVTVGMGVRQ